MKVIFLLDNNEFIELAPEKLQIRQIQPGQSALGYEITVPVLKEDKTPELNEDGSTKTQTGFRPIINYAVNLTVPAPEAPAAAVAPVQEAPAPKAKGKSKRRAN